VLPLRAGEAEQVVDITRAGLVNIEPVRQIGTRPETALGLGRMGGYTDRRFLVLADISGFTAFVTATELRARGGRRHGAADALGLLRDHARLVSLAVDHCRRRQRRLAAGD